MVDAGQRPGSSGAGWGKIEQSRNHTEDMTRFPHLKRFGQDQDGSATVEAVLWLPIMFALLCLAVDTSFLFFGQNQAYHTVQNANRMLSVGQL